MKNQIKIIILSFFTIFFCKNANCCYCLDSATISSSFKQSNLIFKGLILSVRVDNSKRELSYYRIYTVQIEKLYKGHIRHEIVEVLTGFGDGDCGINFEIGKQYIIYSSMDRKFSLNNNLPIDSYFTNECTRTNVFEEQEVEEIKKYKRKHLFWWI